MRSNKINRGILITILKLEVFDGKRSYTLGNITQFQKQMKLAICVGIAEKEMKLNCCFRQNHATMAEGVKAM